jgi:Homeodomain-like domain
MMDDTATLELVDADLAPLEPADASKFTEDQARQWLAENGNAAKSVREIAQLFGWSRSTTQRFVARFRSGTDVGQGAKPVGQTPETGGTDGTERPIATVPHEPPREPQDFDWINSSDVIVAEQDAIAIYVNPHRPRSPGLWRL